MTRACRLVRHALIRTHDSGTPEPESKQRRGKRKEHQRDECPCQPVVVKSFSAQQFKLASSTFKTGLLNISNEQAQHPK